jgi:hypothetical protein
MNTGRSILTLSLLMLAITVPEARAQPLPVFVRAVPDPPPPRATPQQLNEAVRAAQDRMFAIAKEIRKDHGDKREAWPPAALDAVESAENTYNLAIASRDYYSSDTRSGGIDSAVADLVNELAKSKSMTVTASPESAALLLDVVNRRYLSHTAGVTDARYFIRLRIRAGPALDEARFRTASALYRWGPDFLTKAIARPTAESSYWDVEAGSNASYQTAAGIARSVLDAFVKTAALSSPR